jgi:hypothetical protein
MSTSQGEKPESKEGQEPNPRKEETAMMMRVRNRTVISTLSGYHPKLAHTILAMSPYMVVEDLEFIGQLRRR